MNRLNETEKIEERRGGVHRFGELSPSDLDRVAGGFNCWWTDGSGYVIHRTYAEAY